MKSGMTHALTVALTEVSPAMGHVLPRLPTISFLPRCMQCRRDLAMRILSVCLSVHHTRALWQNGRKIFPDLYTIQKNIYPTFLRRRMVGGGRPLLPEILGQLTPIGTKSPIFNQ